jgi:hypothetical protein
MNEIMRDLIGQRVEVWSVGTDMAYHDTGTLEAFEYPWIRLRSDSDEVMCFPVHNVRLVKLCS